ncbi:hypothetical protein SAMN06265348_11755 [Pedobacter westerhofensis]|uniref:Uncharacterized protein n=1 Tax=Pedobacter westerhofensis TaxID=425512 RepID=A0A521FRA8_9SPHI|nr:hypothetical protein [Pedobacter westerhofensis]SMO98662.1 hypothetical protein SAMN06265348_11755 [Pedobacter westerhofensis]
MLEINSRGYLVPHTNIPATLSDLELQFANIPDEPIRRSLFEKYIVYSDELKATLSGHLIIQWIDGSYVTQKKYPNDIDLVSIVDGELIDSIGDKINNFKYPFSLTKYGVDAYIVKIYSEDNRKYPLFLGDRFYWMNNFIKSRRNKYGHQWPKGFLEIIY